MAVTLRYARRAELPAVLGLWAASDAEPTHTDDVESLTRLVDADPEALVVAVENGIIVGSVVAGWDGWRGSIYRLVVAPNHRRRGLGRQLLDRAERSLRERGATRLAAIVVHSDDRAVGFWRSAGWFEQPNRSRFVKG
jgi:ribosomal protein S18 acetylase RimI-like enzyme